MRYIVYGLLIIMAIGCTVVNVRHESPSSIEGPSLFERK